MLELVGFHGTILLTFVNILSLWNEPAYLKSFILFLFANVYINKVLKIIIQQPRPVGYLDKNDMGSYDGIEKYGMPSGHAQLVFFCVVFLWMVIQSPIMAMFGLFICALTVYQRWKCKKHSIEQLAAGAFTGSVVGFSAFLITKNYMKYF